MQLVYTKIPTVVRRNQFVVSFSFEHGDADQRTSYDQKVNLSKEEFVHYLAKAHALAKEIDDARSGGASLADDLEDTASYNGVSIPVESDCFAGMHMSGYYAAMSVVGILYFDENGEQFDVKESR